MKMSKKQKIKLIIAVICLIASVAIAALSIGGIVSAATASYNRGEAEGGYAVLGLFAFVIAILATMVVCTFTLSAAAMLALAALLLFERMLPDDPDAPNILKASNGSHSALKVLYVTSRVLFVAEALCVLALLAIFAVYAIFG
jgi:hypothetical protein